MEEPHVIAIKEIISTIPKNKIIPYREAIDISLHLIPLYVDLMNSSKSMEAIREIIRIIKNRYIEDLITISSVLSYSASILDQQTRKPVSDEIHGLIEMVCIELQNFPGGFLIREADDLKPLVYKLIDESDIFEEWKICNSEPDALLLDTDFGFATIGKNAMIDNDSKTELHIYQKRNRMSRLRKKISLSTNNSG